MLTNAGDSVDREKLSGLRSWCRTWFLCLWITPSKSWMMFNPWCGLYVWTSRGKSQRISGWRGIDVYYVGIDWPPLLLKKRVHYIKLIVMSTCCLYKSMNHRLCVESSEFQVYEGRFPRFLADSKILISLSLFANVEHSKVSSHIRFSESWIFNGVTSPSTMT